jgi:hypothetical protein
MISGRVHTGKLPALDTLIRENQIQYHMSRAKPRGNEGDPLKSAQSVLSLSDEDFGRWLDKVIDAGLKIGR